MAQEKGKVYFIGGGPGDPELLTLKAKRAIESADVVIYADSLVHPSIAGFAKPTAEVHGSKGLTLPEIMGLTVEAVNQGKTVARVQSGDPAIYGAILEQMRVLEREAIDYEIIPGVSSAFAAAALLKAELTVPELSQTVIMTRAEGRISMPPREQLRGLAAHGCTMVIFLSITRTSRIVRELRSAGYPRETPVAVVYRVGWPDQQVIRGTLADIVAKVREAKITLQALILVGPALDPSLRLPGPPSETPVVSHLYSDGYTHLYRRSPDQDHIEGGKGAWSPLDEGRLLTSTAVVAISRHGSGLARTLTSSLGGEVTLYLERRFHQEGDGAVVYQLPVRPLLQRLFLEHQQLVLFMPVGAAMRILAPCLNDKPRRPCRGLRGRRGAFRREPAFRSPRGRRSSGSGGGQRPRGHTGDHIGLPRHWNPGGGLVGSRVRLANRFETGGSDPGQRRRGKWGTGRNTSRGRGTGMVACGPPAADKCDLIFIS